MPDASTGSTQGFCRKAVSRNAVAAVRIKMPTAAKARTC